MRRALTTSSRIDWRQRCPRSLSALMVRVECGRRFSIRLMMEDAAGLPNVDKYKVLGKITIDDADGALCATLAFDLGGECA